MNLARCHVHVVETDHDALVGNWGHGQAGGPNRHHRINPVIEMTSVAGPRTRLIFEYDDNIHCGRLMSLWDALH